MTFVLRRSRVPDREQQAVNEGLVMDLNAIGRFVSWGEGAPTHTPDGPQIYFEQDGPGVHVFIATGWNELT